MHLNVNNILATNRLQWYGISFYHFCTLIILILLEILLKIFFYQSIASKFVNLNKTFKTEIYFNTKSNFLCFTFDVYDLIAMILRVIQA